MTIVILSFRINAQSKKEQIAQLNHKSDSLRYVLQYEYSKSDSLLKVLIVKDSQLNKTGEVLVSTQTSLSNLQRELAVVNSLWKKEKEQFISKIADLEQSGKDLQSKLGSINSELMLSIDKLIEIKNLNQILETQLTKITTEKEMLLKQINKIVDTKGELDSTAENDGEKSPIQNGMYITYYSQPYSSKQVFIKGKYKNGKKEGLWTQYLCDGKVQMQGAYKNGFKEGKWINYDFCNEIFDFVPNSLLDSINTIRGYFDMLTTIGGYYSNSSNDFLKSIEKEVIFFSGGKPADTLYYVNKLDQIKFKIARNTGMMFYENNQPFIKQKYVFEYPNLFTLSDEDLVLYHRNGKMAYKYVNTGKRITETYYNNDGKVFQRLEYNNGITFTFDRSGKLIEKYEAVFGEGKWGGECPCQ